MQEESDGFLKVPETESPEKESRYAQAPAKSVVASTFLQDLGKR